MNTKAAYIPIEPGTGIDWRPYPQEKPEDDTYWVVWFIGGMKGEIETWSIGHYIDGDWRVTYRKTAIIDRVTHFVEINPPEGA